MDRDPKEVQAELDAAQADLEHKVGQLKELVDDKLETPKAVVNAVRDPKGFLADHAVATALAAAGVVGYIVLRAVLNRRRHRHYRR